MTYGALLSGKLVSEGKFQEAVEAATSEITLQPDEPEAYFNRGQARVGLDHLAEAVSDYERALKLDASNSALDPEAADDELFFALRMLAAQQQDRAVAIATVKRYLTLLPGGRHIDDVAKWIDKFNGVETLWYRDRA
ncbi:MAG: Tetratricopeptide repeat [Myxococcales bacterium]|jgi:tetratricopeptide (TPR) repeat protein|nr:Tetratricopeptide repeat [Myxococcales bacterium]